MSMFPPQSIGRRFAGSVISVVSCILLAFAAGAAFYNVRAIEARLQQRLARAADVARLSLSHAIWEFNAQYVEDFLEPLFLDEEIVFAQVSSSNAVIAERTRPEFSDKPFEFFAQSDAFMVASTPIQHEGRSVGEIKLVVTRRAVWQSVIKHTAAAIAVGLVVVGAIFLTTLTISRRHVFRPLERLRRSAALVADGDLAAHIDTSGADEIGQLASTFDLMMTNLRAITASRDELDHEVEERKQAEKALEESVFWLKESQRVSGIGSYILDIRVGRWTSSEALDEIFGIDNEYQRTVDGWLDIVHPEQRAEMLAYFETSVLRERQAFDREYRIVRPGDGGQAWVHGRGELVFDGDDPVRMIGTIQDITERKHAEQEIASLARFPSENNNPVLRIHGEGTVMYANAAAEPLMQLFGADVGQVVTDEWRDLVADVFKAGESKNVEVQDHESAFAVSLVPVSGGGYVNLYVRDIKQEKLLAEQLFQAQKMEAMGVLAGGVAHDFNNILTIISGQAQLMGMLDERSDKDREGLVTILHSCDRAAGLIGQLLAFSRKQTLEFKVLDLNKLLTNLTKMLRRLIGENIELVSELSADELWIEADAGQIEQIVMNLAINARDAMGDGGRLTIRSQPVNIARPQLVREGEIEPGKYVRLSVTDTGAGMDAATLAQIFEPFFTTKETGKGTGLGLATVHGIVKQSGGHISVNSALGRGATFNLFFAAVDSALGESTEAWAAPEPDERGGTVFLVEDEEGVLLTVKMMLEELGYSVLAADCPAAALELYPQHAGEIDVILSDVVMPQMSGPEMVDQLRRGFPDLKAVYMSGNMDAGMFNADLFAGNARLLQKPFTPTLLIARLREAMAAE